MSWDALRSIAERLVVADLVEGHHQPDRLADLAVAAQPRLAASAAFCRSCDASRATVTNDASTMPWSTALAVRPPAVSENRFERPGLLLPGDQPEPGHAAHRGLRRAPARPAGATGEPSVQVGVVVDRLVDRSRPGTGPSPSSRSSSSTCWAATSSLAATVTKPAVLRAASGWRGRSPSTSSGADVHDRVVHLAEVVAGVDDLGEAVEDAGRLGVGRRGYDHSLGRGSQSSVTSAALQGVAPACGGRRPSLSRPASCGVPLVRTCTHDRSHGPPART